MVRGFIPGNMLARMGAWLYQRVLLGIFFSPSRGWFVSFSLSDSLSCRNCSGIPNYLEFEGMLTSTDISAKLPGESPRFKECRIKLVSDDKIIISLDDNFHQSITSELPLRYIHEIGHSSRHLKNQNGLAEYVFEDSGNTVSLLETGSLVHLKIDNDTLISRSVLVSEQSGGQAFTLLASDGFTDAHKNLIHDAYFELRGRCGIADGRVRIIQDRAIELINKNPLPALETTDTSLGSFHWNNITSILFYLSCPFPSSRRYTGSRTLIVDEFDENSNVYGRTTVAVMNFYNPPPHAFAADLMTTFNIHNLDLDRDVRAWAGVMAHKVLHQFFGTFLNGEVSWDGQSFEGGHGRHDFIYAVGDAVDSRTEADFRPTYLA